MAESGVIELISVVGIQRDWQRLEMGLELNLGE